MAVNLPVRWPRKFNVLRLFGKSSPRSEDEPVPFRKMEEWVF